MSGLALSFSNGNILPSLNDLKNNTIVKKVTDKVNDAYKNIKKTVTAPENNVFGSDSNVQINKPIKGEFEKIALSLFDKSDTNNNTFLSKSELVAKRDDYLISGKDSAVFAVLAEHSSKIENLSKDETFIELSGITKKDIFALDALPSTNELKSSIYSDFYSCTYKSLTNCSENKDKEGKLKLPQKPTDVNYKDLQQGQLGDCYFLAALASLAQKHPEKVVSMIKDNNNGTYTVNFAKKSVTVHSPSDGELGMYGNGKAWVPIIEKAYAEYRKETDIIKSTDPYNNIGNGSIIVGRGIKDLTGHDFKSSYLKVSSYDTTRASLSTAVTQNKMMTVSVNKEIFKKNQFDLPDGHVYTVLGYDPKTDKVKIRNPWGEGEGKISDGANDGIFDLSIKDFQKTFDVLAIEK